MAKFFIDRPIFAIVIAIVTVILGAVAIPNLPIATYPEVVPPVVQITANLRGGNAQDLERTVAQPVEQQLVALDGMLYFFSRSSNDGVLTVDVTFDLGTNVDTAVVQTQNRVNLALPQLPPEVQREGVTVKKLSTAILLGMRLPQRTTATTRCFSTTSSPSICSTGLPASRRRGGAPRVPPGLRDARLGQSLEDGDAGPDRDRPHGGHPGAESSEPIGFHRPAPGRVRDRSSVSGERRRPAR
jgi:Cation/multidrug efflux pump